MTQVDRVTQTNAAAAEELSSTAEEMASEALTLQQLMNFFQTKAPAAHLNLIGFSRCATSRHQLQQRRMRLIAGFITSEYALELSRSTGHQTLTAKMTNSHVGGD